MVIARRLVGVRDEAKQLFKDDNRATSVAVDKVQVTLSDHPGNFAPRATVAASTFSLWDTFTLQTECHS